MSEPDDNALIGALPLRLKVPMLMGLVVQADLRLERALRHLWLELVGEGPARHVVPTQTPQLVEQCKAMIYESALSKRGKAAARLVLDDAAAAHVQRNRIAHDSWFPGVEDDVVDEDTLIVARYRPNRLDPELTTRTISDATGTLRRFAQVAFRLTTLHLMLIHDYADDAKGLARDLSTLEHREDLRVKAAGDDGTASGAFSA